MSDLQDDLRAAITSNNDGTPPDTAPVAPPSEVLAPVAPDQRPGEINRGADGKFTPTAPGTPRAASGDGQPAPGTGVATPAPDALGGPPVAPGTGAGTGLALDPSKPPSAWTPAMKAKWNGLPEDARLEITRREEASARGVAHLKQQYEPMERLYKDVVTPNQQYFEHIQRDPREYFGEMVIVEQALSLGNPAQKMQTLLNLAAQYGIPLAQTLDAAMGGKLNSIMQEAHRTHQTPPMLPPEVVRELQMYRQRDAEAVDLEADEELAEFMADTENHPFFGEVKDKMADLIEKGLATDYEDAYEMAVWQTAGTRQKMLARQNGQAQANGIAQRQAQAGRISTPMAAPVVQTGAPNPNETTEDAVRAAWAANATPGGV